MCTITYIPGPDSDFMITHNRDEDIRREGGSPPEVETITKRKVIMPRDRQSGGTWMAAEKNGNVYCIINGAFRRHKPVPPYKHSRGLIIPEAMEAEYFRDYYRESDFEGIEPFTLLHINTGLIEKIVWDGKYKFYGQPDAEKPQLFTSATLYNEETGRKRTEHFHDFLKKHPYADTEDVLQLHQNKHTEAARSFILETDIGVQTVSITQVAKRKGKIHMVYIDLLHKQRFEESL